MKKKKRFCFDAMWTTVFRTFMSFLKDSRRILFNFIIFILYTHNICLDMHFCYNKTRNEKSLEYSFITNAHFVLFFFYISFSFPSWTDDQFKFYNIIHLFCLMVVPKNKIKRREFCCILNWIEEFLVIFVS